MPSLTEIVKEIDQKAHNDLLDRNLSNAHNASAISTFDGRTVQERLDDLPSEVDASGTAANLIAQHNTDASAHVELSGFITNEANRAELAADVATTHVGIYATNTDGLNAVVEGEFFSVAGEDDTFVTLYRKVGGAAVYKNKYPSKEHIDNAIRGSVSTNRLSFLESFTNLVNPLGEGYGVVGYYTGNYVTPTAGWITMNKIPCKPGDTLLFKGRHPTFTAFFNESGVQLDTLNASIVPTTVQGQVPYFYSFSVRDADVGNAMSGIGEWLPDTFSEFNVEVIRVTNESFLQYIADTESIKYITQDRMLKNSVTGQSTSFTDSFINLIDKNTEGFGLPGYWNGTSSVNDTNWSRTGIIPCKSGDEFVGVRVHPSIMALFDVNGIQRGTTSASNGKYTIPETIFGYKPMYCAVSSYSYNIETVMLSKYTSVQPGSEYIEYNEEVVELSNKWLLDKLYSNNPKLTGKKWSYLGDSISARAGSYAEILGQKHMMVLQKHAADGAHLSKDVSGQLIISEEYLNVDVDSDFVTIAAGTNDSIVNIGTMESRDIESFYGACHTVFKGVLQRCTSAKIGVFTLLPRSDMNSVGNGTRMKADIIKEVAQYYGIPVLELHNLAGRINPTIEENRILYMPDGLHPNSLGYTVYAEIVENFLLTL